MGIPIFATLDAGTGGFMTAMRGAAAELRALGETGEISSARLRSVGTVAALGITAAAAVVAEKTVKMAGDYQSLVTHLVTDDGELRQNMQMISQGMLQIARDTGTSVMELGDAMKPIESSGFHGAAALNVLHAAAEGAKVGNANLTTVTNALTSIMNSYGPSVGNATQVTDALVETVKNGKIRMEDLAGAIGNVAPAAATAHLGLQEVLGAMTTMTSQGTDASKAATYLRQTIVALSDPSNKARTELQGLGVDATDLAQHFGERGLTGSLKIVTDAITSKLAPSGLVAVDTFKKSAGSAADLQAMIANLPPTMQTTVGALANVMGGAKSMQAALELTGPAAGHFNTAVHAIGESLHSTGKDVQDWSEIQGTYNQKVSELKETFETLGITIGTKLLPAFSAIADGLLKVAGFVEHHKTAMYALAVVVGVVLVTAFALAATAAWSFAAGLWATGIPEIIIGITLAVVGIVAAIHYVWEHWSTIWGWIKGAALDVWHVIDGAWHGIEDVTETVWDAIVDVVRTVWNTIKTVITTAVHIVIDPVVSAWRTIASVTRTVWNGISSFIRTWWPLLLAIFAPFIVAIVATWRAFHRDIENIARTAWNAVSSFLSGVWNAIKAVAAAVWAVIRTVIVTPVTETWHTIESIWTTVSSWLSGLWNGISSTASSIWHSIYSTIASVIESCWHHIVTIGESIWQAIKSPFEKALGFLRGMIGQFMSIGSDIVNGIIRGVESAAGSLISMLEGLAHRALNAAKSALGISSPSRVFAVEVGHWIPAGIAQGINNNASAVHRAIADVSRPGGVSGTVGVRIAAGVQPGGSASGTVTINVHMHGPVYGAGGIPQLAKDIRTELLKLGRRTPLGLSFSGAVTI